MRFAGFPVAYQLGHQRQGSGIVAHLVRAYLEQAKQVHPRSPSVPHRALEIAEGSKSRLLTQLVGRGPLPLPSGLSEEIAVQEQQFLAELTALDVQELAIHDHFAYQEETSHLQRLQQRQATLRELEELWALIARAGSEGTAYVALRSGAAPTLQELARLTKALGPATALISFFTTTDRALLFLLRAGWRCIGPILTTGVLLSSWGIGINSGKCNRRRRTYMWLTTPNTIEQVLVERPLEPVSNESLDQSARDWQNRGVKLAPSEALRSMPVVSIGQPESWTLQDFHVLSKLPRPIRTKLSQADFYLVRLSCSFHPVNQESRVEWARFRAALLPDPSTGGQPLAFDLYPLQVMQEVKRQVKITLSPSLKFQELEASLAVLSLDSSTPSLFP